MKVKKAGILVFRCLGFRFLVFSLQGTGFRVQGSGFRCLGFRVWGFGFGSSGFSVEGLGLQGSGNRVQGLGFGGHRRTNKRENRKEQVDQSWPSLLWFVVPNPLKTQNLSWESGQGPLVLGLVLLWFCWFGLPWRTPRTFGPSTRPPPPPCLHRMGPVGFSRSVRVHVASGAHVEVLFSVSQGQVASMLEPCVARGAERRQEGDLLAEVRAWKLFCLVLVMILCKPKGVGSVSRDELAKQIQDFEEGRWVQLLEAVFD